MKKEDEDKKQNKDETTESIFDVIIEIPTAILESIGEILS